MIKDINKYIDDIEISIGFFYKYDSYRDDIKYKLKYELNDMFNPYIEHLVTTDILFKGYLQCIKEFTFFPKRIRGLIIRLVNDESFVKELVDILYRRRKKS